MRAIYNPCPNWDGFTAALCRNYTLWDFDRALLHVPAPPTSFSWGHLLINYLHVDPDLRVYFWETQSKLQSKDPCIE